MLLAELLLYTSNVGSAKLTLIILIYRRFTWKSHKQKDIVIYKKLVLQDKRSKKLDFKPDGREHYVYRITDYTRGEKEHYIGSHTPKKEKVYK